MTLPTDKPAPTLDESTLDLPLDLDHMPADYAEAVEMLRRAKRRLQDSLRGVPEEPDGLIHLINPKVKKYLWNLRAAAEGLVEENGRICAAHKGTMAEADRRLEQAESALKLYREALLPIANSYPDDIGTSDLENEQPVTITLGDVRRVWAALSREKAGGRG